MNPQPIKVQVQQMRLQKVPIRTIAHRLQVTKHTVEKALKELESDRVEALLQTRLQEEQTRRNNPCQTQENDCQTELIAEKTALIVNQTPQQSSQTAPKTGQTGQQSCFRHGELIVAKNLYADNKQENQLKVVENTEKTAEYAYKPSVFSFMMDYRKQLRLLQRWTNDGWSVWVHEVQGKYLKQLENLQERARVLCQRHGLSYESMLLSEVLGACREYMLKALQTAPVQFTLLGRDSIKLPQNHALYKVLAQAIAEEFFCVVPKSHYGLLPS